MLPSAELRSYGLWWRARCHAVALALGIALSPPAAQPHDPDVWGGLFRTHDAGATWTPVNPGIFVSGALAFAISPRDPHHLLLATDSGVWRSRNGGRDWEVEAPDVLIGPAFAAAFDLDGNRALIAGRSALFRDDGDRWRTVATPAGAAPVRALATAAVPGRVYLAGRSGLYRSDDWGRSWVDVRGALRAEHVNSLVVPPGRPDEVHVVAAGAVWSSKDAARTWQPRREGSAVPESIEVVGLDPSNPARLWAVGGGQAWRSDRQGERWVPVGKPIPDGPVRARGVAVWGDAVVIATDRGVFRSADAGETWEPPKEGLPAHLSAGVLTRDPRSPATFYAGFALAQYEDLQHLAAPAGKVVASSGWTRTTGAVAVLVVLALGAIATALYLARRRHRGRPDRRGAPADRGSLVRVPR